MLSVTHALDFARALAGVLALFLGFPTALAAADAVSLRLIWQKEISEVGLWCDYQSACFTGKQIALVYASSPSPLVSTSPTNVLNLIRVDSDGNASKPVRIKKPVADAVLGLTNFALSTAKSVSPVDASGLAAAVEFVEEFPWMVNFGEEGKEPLLARISASPKKFTLNRIVPTGSGDFLALGHSGFNALAIRISREGKPSWEETSDWGVMDFFLDGVPGNGKAALLVGNTGVYDMLGHGKSRVVLVRYDASGKLAQQRTFLGRRGSLLRGSEKTFALVYDQSESNAQRIRLKYFAEDDLRDLEELDVCEGTEGTSNFKLQPGRDGSVLVAGSRNGALFIAKFVSGKGRIWSFSTDQIDPAVDYDLLSAGDGSIYVLYSAYLSDAQQNIRRSIKVAKFAEQ